MQRAGGALGAVVAMALISGCSLAGPQVVEPTSEGLPVPSDVRPSPEPAEGSSQRQYEEALAELAEPLSRLATTAEGAAAEPEQYERELGAAFRSWFERHTDLDPVLTQFQTPEEGSPLLIGLGVNAPGPLCLWLENGRYALVKQSCIDLYEGKYNMDYPGV